MKLTIVLTIFATLTLIHYSNESFTIKATNAKCESYNKSWVIVPTCRLKAIRRNMVIFNYNCTLLHPVDDVVMNFRVFKRANGWKPWLFNFIMDICQFLRHPYSPTFKLFYAIVQDFSSYNHTCPYVDAVIFKLTNAVCESYNKSWVILNTCRLKAVSRNRANFNFNCTILHPVNDFRVHIQFFKRANGYKPWLYSINIDVCRFLLHPYNPIAKLVYDFGKDNTNFYHNCPYVGDQIVKDLYPKVELLRLPLPTGDYLIATRWFYDRKLQIDVNISYSFIEDLIHQ